MGLPFPKKIRHKVIKVCIFLYMCHFWKGVSKSRAFTRNNGIIVIYIIQLKVLSHKFYILAYMCCVMILELLGTNLFNIIKFE